jgi:acyl-CoA reductase-like NAD-dependent aldehyde dehydrogenase
MYIEKIFNHITKEETIREFTPAEVAKVEAALAAALEKTAEAEAKAAVRDSALAKLAALGLSAEEIAAL